MDIILPDPNKHPLNEDALHDVIMAEAERYAHGERIVLARTIRRAITGYLARIEGTEPAPNTSTSPPSAVTPARGAGKTYKKNPLCQPPPPPSGKQKSNG